MSEVQAPTTAAPQAPAAASPFQQAVAMLTRPPQGAQEAVVEPDGAQPAEGAPTGAEPAPKAEDADLKRAREQQAYLKRQRDQVEAKRRTEELEAKLRDYAAFDGSDPKAIRAALKARGVTLEALARAELEDDTPEPEPEDPRVKELRERLEAMESEKANAEAARVREQNVAFVGELISKGTDKYPALASYAPAAKMVVSRFEKHVAEHGVPENPDALVEQFTAELQEHVNRDLDTIFTSDVALKAFLTRPEIQTRALALLGAKQSAGPASGEGKGRGNGAPSSILSAAVASGGARQARPQSFDERFAAAAALLNKKS